MLGYLIRIRFTMPRMKSLPEPSKSFDDLVKTDGEFQSVDLVEQKNNQLTNQEQVNSGLPEIDPRDRFTWSNFFIVLSIPFVGGLVGLGIIYLANPLAVGWLASSDAPIFYSNSLWNIPKSIPQTIRRWRRST